jgi:hypothetical protein
MNESVLRAKQFFLVMNDDISNPQHTHQQRTVILSHTSVQTLVPILAIHTGVEMRIKLGERTAAK